VAQYPPLSVEAPPVDAATPGGLFTVARLLQGVDLPADGNGTRWEAGVQYQVETCADVSGWTEVCPPTVPVDKTFDLRFPTVTGTPFIAYLGIDCPLVGYTLEEFATGVRNGFLANEQRLVEQAFWTGEFGNSPSLAGTDEDPSDCVDLTPGGGALSVVGGISALEGYLGANYGGVGIIHAPRTVAPYAAQAYQIERSGQRLTTTLGTRWAFGGGYLVNTGPDGVVAPAGEAWLYATGAVTIYRGEVFVNPDELRAAFDTRTNQVEILAERKYVITRECVCAAVRVTLDCAC
jgi:hypothetical protein